VLLDVGINNSHRQTSAISPDGGDDYQPSVATHMSRLEPSRLRVTSSLIIVVITITMRSRMHGTAQSGSQGRRTACPEEAAFLDLLRTTHMLSRGLVRVLKSEELSATQYNVLRILRGAPEGLPCGEIASRR
jgi:hypothetical protein